MKQWKQALNTFLFPAETDLWLGLLRIGLGLQVVLYAISFKDDWSYLFFSTGQGIDTRRLTEALLSLESSFIPRVGWLVELGARVGLGEGTVVSAIWWGLLTTGAALLAGFLSKTSAILAWFLHLCAAKSGGFLSYGVDQFMTIGLFYLMLTPLPDQYSVDHWLRKTRPGRPELLGFWRRVLQVHLCLIYFFSGLAKFLGTGWWNGANLWRALIRPPFNVIAPEFLVRWKYLFPIAGISICIIETGYVIFIWPRQTRRVWLVAVIAMHTAIALTMGMYLFGLIMIVLNAAAFGAGSGIGRRRSHIARQQLAISA